MIAEPGIYDGYYSTSPVHIIGGATGQNTIDSSIYVYPVCSNEVTRLSIAIQDFKESVIRLKYYVRLSRLVQKSTEPDWVPTVQSIHPPRAEPKHWMVHRQRNFSRHSE